MSNIINVLLKKLTVVFIYKNFNGNINVFETFWRICSIFSIIACVIIFIKDDRIIPEISSVILFSLYVRSLKISYIEERINGFKIVKDYLDKKAFSNNS